jgi:AbrB family looped-hinge helix DNA binding protein
MPGQNLPVQEEWLRILTKGMITIPKVWREELGLQEGKIIRAKKIADQIVIESKEKTVPYRVYSRAELEQFLKDDRLSKKTTAKIDKKLRNLKQ